MEGMNNLTSLLGDNLTLAAVTLATFIEIAPIKINPWSRIISYISEAMIGDFKKEFQEFKKESEEKAANDMRWNILAFANSCRRGQEHSKDEWWHAIEQIKAYEHYTEEKGIENGVIEEDSKYLRELYRERNIKNDFLGGNKNE